MTSSRLRADARASSSADAPVAPTIRTVLTAAFVAATVVSLALAVSMPNVLLESPLNWFVMVGGGVLAFGFVVASGHAERSRVARSPAAPEGERGPAAPERNGGSAERRDAADAPGRASSAPPDAA